ncbi:hypothetical protein [Endozoicomonas ascidiicola]|uniref:hypothetical protein n=1 Tax=Endozoicomonas ascidiicola TaxID=1698521 RepID=UPI00083298F7|nr:hypothetical protein [Endozoicomonas ascidiicola]
MSILFSPSLASVNCTEKERLRKEIDQLTEEYLENTGRQIPSFGMIRRFDVTNFNNQKTQKD